MDCIENFLDRWLQRIRRSKFAYKFFNGIQHSCHASRFREMTWRGTPNAPSLVGKGADATPFRCGPGGNSGTIDHAEHPGKNQPVGFRRWSALGMQWVWIAGCQ